MDKLGVDKTKDIIIKSSDLLCLGIEIVKKGLKLSALLKLGGAVKDLQDIVKEVPEILPEFKDLDKKEVELLAGVAFEAVVKVISKLRDNS
jgi:hypothetical protein